MARWLIPTLAFIVTSAGMGVTSKLALRSLGWQELIVWTGIGYVLVAGAMVASGRVTPSLGGGSGWAIASAALAIGGLLSLYVALSSGEVGKVMPISAAYPALALLLAVALLGEQITVKGVAGVCLVVLGVAVLTT